MIEYLHNIYINHSILYLDKKYIILEFLYSSQDNIILLLDDNGHIDRYRVLDFIDKYYNYLRNNQLREKIEKIKNNM